MKTKLERIEKVLCELRDQASDDELVDEIDDAIIALQTAIDRITQIEEETLADNELN